MDRGEAEEFLEVAVKVPDEYLLKPHTHTGAEADAVYTLRESTSEQC
jgi:hypothetical protein